MKSTTMVRRYGFALLATLTAACAEPSYVLDTGTAVFDVERLVDEHAAQTVVDRIRETMPNTDVARVGRWAETTVTFQRAYVDCGKVKRASGCFDVDASTITIAVRDCSGDDPWQGVLAHELGHALGHHKHHASPEWFSATGIGTAVSQWACPAVAPVAPNHIDDEPESAEPTTPVSSNTINTPSPAPGRPGQGGSR